MGVSQLLSGILCGPQGRLHVLEAYTEVGEHTVGRLKILNTFEKKGK